VSGGAAPYRIRRARLSERRVIQELIHKAYLPLTGPLGIEYQVDPFNFLWQIVNRRIWVLEERGELLGTVMLSDDSVRLLIFYLAVLPSAQGRGIGRALMEFAEAHTRRHGFVGLMLHTPAGFTGALAFYRHLGFAEVEGGFGDDDRFVLLMKRLSATTPPPSGASARRPTGPLLRG
jgi:GNAT superfamily N-acetyltransferase